MKDQLKKLRAQIKVLAIKADLTDAEDAELKKMMTQAVKLEGQIEAAALAAKGDEVEQAAAEAARKEAERKAADVEHRRTVNREAVQTLMDNSALTKEQAQNAIGAIVGGLVKHVTIKY